MLIIIFLLNWQELLLGLYLAVDDDSHGDLVHHLYAHLGDDFVVYPLPEPGSPFSSHVHHPRMDCALVFVDLDSRNTRLRLPLRDRTDDHRRLVFCPWNSFIITIFMQSQVCLH